jgi:hypothetical protein
MADAAVAMTQAAPAAEGRRFSISAEWLTGRSFSFRAEPTGVLFSRGFVFEPDGAISGYEHPNEVRWRLDDGRLEVLNFEGKPSCILNGYQVGDNVKTLRGPFINADRPQPETQVVHVFDENPDDGREIVSTFDLFDTLVARRCYDPTEIFAIVERQSGVSGFAKRRRQVEMAMFGRRLYTFDDIYAQLAAEEGWAERQRSVLQMMELTAEWDNLYAIRETVAKVRRRDLIISDMYLPADFIRKVAAEKCGLTGNAVVVSNYGKHLGVVWPHLLQRYNIFRHFGDNPHADIVSPKQHGIEGRYISTAQWSAAEKILIECGLRPFAQALRETRLTSFDVNPWLRAAQVAQTEFNLPFLLICSVFLLLKAREKQADTLLLCARDCNLLLPILTAIARHEPTARRIHYIAASRKVFYSGQPEYEAYFRSMMGRQNLLIDIVGTGQSLCHFIHSLGEDARVTPMPLVGDPQVEGFGGIKLECLTKQPFSPVRMALEAFNMSLDGTALSCRFDNYQLQVSRAENEFNPHLRQVIMAMKAVANTLVGTLVNGCYWVAPDDLDKSALETAAEKLLSLVPQHMALVHPITQAMAALEKRGV